MIILEEKQIVKKMFICEINITSILIRQKLGSARLAQ